MTSCLRRLLDFVDARGIELRGSAREARRRSLRDELRFFHRLARGELDFEPRSIALLRRPELRESARGVTRESYSPDITNPERARAT